MKNEKEKAEPSSVKAEQNDISNDINSDINNDINNDSTV